MGDLVDTPNLRLFADKSAAFDNAWGEGLPTISRVDAFVQNHDVLIRR